MSEKTNMKVGLRKLSTIQKLEKMHPYKMMVLLSMIGSSLIFVFLLIAYGSSVTASIEQNVVSLPRALFVSTLLLLLAHFFIQPIIQQFHAGQIKKMKLNLMVSLFFGSAFIVSQLYAWKSLKLQGIIFTGSPADSFLYILTALHGIHLLGVMIFTFVIYSQTNKIENDPVQYLIAETNPFWKVKLEILHIVWGFLDALWLILFLFFLFSV